MSLETGILGFLSMKPLSGYDIKKLFDMSASYFWPADQSQIYRTLKTLVKNELVEMSECKKGHTVDRKVYAITDKGQEAYLSAASKNDIDDFISRDAFLLQLFFSGTLSEAEQLEFIEKQLVNVRALEKQLIDNYSENATRFRQIAELAETDRRFHSAVCAHRWGLIKCKEYAKLLREIKRELLNT